MKKFLSIFLAIIMIVASMPVAFAASDIAKEVSITFDDVSYRNYYSSEKQVWEQNGITVTNTKHKSSSDVTDQYGPINVKKDSKLTIEHPGITEIVIECADATSATRCLESDYGNEIYTDVYSKSVKGNNVTLVLRKLLNSFSFIVGKGGIKINKITVFYEETADRTTYVNVNGSLVTLGDFDMDGLFDIGTPDQLYAFSEIVASRTVNIGGELICDIVINENVLDADGNLNGDGSNFRFWAPIREHGSDIYGGYFDGNNYTISGLYYNSSSAIDVGMFGILSGTVRNLNIVDSYICGHSEVGGLAGCIAAGAVVTDCYFEGTVIGEKRVGGFVGHSFDSSIGNCHANANVKGGSEYCGGFTGSNCGAYIKNSYFTGTVSGSVSVGGLAGTCYSDGIFEDCYNEGTVYASSHNTGGLVGLTEGATIINSYNKGDVTGCTTYTGGLVGYNCGNYFENCYNEGHVKGNESVGGLIGKNYNGGTIKNCYNTGDVSGILYDGKESFDIGGIVGTNGPGAMECCYNTGNVSGHQRVGGLAGGAFAGSINNSYNTGSVSGEENVSGIAALMNNRVGKITNCFNIGELTATESTPAPIISLHYVGTISNCYYLSSTAKPNKKEAKTEEQFSSGEVAYLLQGDQTEHVWGQKIGVDELPVYCGAKVYEHKYCNGNVVYSNKDSAYIHTYLKSVCMYCGEPCDHSVKNECVCSLCGGKAHAYEETSRIEATCNAQGIAIYNCADCGDEYYEIFNSTGHKFTYTYDSSTHKGVCEYCGYIEQYVHEYEREYFDPTCETDGYYTDTCKCGYSYSKVTSTKYYHTGGEATCYSLAICDVCGNTYGDYLDHTGGTPTCTEPAKCEVCGEGYGQAKGHIADMDDGDCTTDIPCSVCGISYIKGNAVHTWNENNFCANENCRQTKGFTFTFTYGEEVLFVRNVHTGNFYHFESAEERDGMTLLGWDEDGDGVIDYEVNEYIYIDEDRTFEAVYGLIYTIHYITYDIWNNCYDEVFFPQTGEPGDTITLYDDYSYYYKFLGWALEEDGEVVYEPGQEITLTENLTLYGIIRPYQATFDIGEGAVWNDEDGNPITIIQGDYEASWIEIYDFPTKTGYIFTGFADQYDGTWSPWENEDTGVTMLDFYFDGSDLEMTAQWEKCRNHNYIDDVCEYCGLNSADECKHLTGTQTCMGYKCDNCGDFYGEAGDHYGTKLTCQGYLCDTCGETYGDTVGNHDFENGICTVCDAVSPDVIVIEMRDDYGDGWNRAKLAVYTLDADGNETEYKLYTLETGDYAKELIISDSDTVYRFYWIAGDYDYECSLTIKKGDETLYEVDDCSYIRAGLFMTVTVDVCEHDYVAVETKAPTCTEKGEMTYACACGDTYTEEIPANGHSITAVEAKDPTCEEVGYEAYEYCSACDYTTYSEIAATGHDYAELVSKTATCTKNGEKTFSCPCGDTYTEEIPANGHSITTVEAKDPTCTEPGYEAYEFCSACDYTTYSEIAANGHDYVAVETKAPTCTEKGEMAYTCACGDTYTEEIVADENAHDWSDCDGICVNGCGYECAHESNTDNVCDICGKLLHICDFSGEWKYNNEKHWKECTCGIKDGEAEHSFTDGKCNCGYECLHEEAENMLIRPVQNGDGTWGKGAVISYCDDCGLETVVQEVERDHAGYEAFDEAAAELEDLLNNGNLIDNAKNSYTNSLNAMRNSAYAIVQTELDTALLSMAASIYGIIETINAGIADGTMVKADFTYMTSLFDEINALIDNDPNKLIPSESGRFQGIYYGYYMSCKNDGNHSQANYDQHTADNNWEGQIEAVLAGVKDGTALKADYTEIDAAIATLDEKLADVNLTDEAKAEFDAIKAQLAEMKENVLSSKADVAELMESVTAFADTVAPCINGTHTFEYEVTSPAECEKNAVETGTCEYCDTTTEREVENSALTHADEDGDYICDNGCGYEYEKPEEPAPEEPSEPSEPEEPAPEEPTPEAPEDTESEVCEDCGKVHNGFFAELICFFTRIINFIKNLFA